MKLEIGKIYENKTKMFLLPCLTAYGKGFETRFNSLYKLAVGVHDVVLQGNPVTEGNLIYILFDRKFKEKDFNSFLNWIKLEDYYITDYCSGVELDSRKHMVVLTFPPIYTRTYKKFLMGKYSEMFNEQQLNDLFNKPHRKKALKILNKTDDALKDYTQELNKHFKTDYTFEEYRDHNEYSMPMWAHEEIFNYPDEGCLIMFNEDCSKSWVEKIYKKDEK